MDDDNRLTDLLNEGLAEVKASGKPAKSHLKLAAQKVEIAAQHDPAAEADGAYKALAFTSPVDLQDQPIPEREWIVPGWLSARTVTLLYGAGGEGKTLLAQQLMTSCATGRSWLGMDVTPCRALGLFCEDEPDEMQRRQVAINRAYGCDFRDLGDMLWSCPVGDDNTLILFSQEGRPVFTERFHDLRQQAERFRPKVIVLDVLADLFGGEENRRRDVSLFLKTQLGSLARDLDCAVILNAHPSRSGIKSGELDGASTGWNGAARARWALQTPKPDDGEAPDPDARLLTLPKANYGQRGAQMRLRFTEGLLQRDGQELFGTVAGLDRRKCEDVFLDLLARISLSGRHASDSINAGTYAPRLFAKRTDRQGYTRQDFERAMHRLFELGAIRREQYGKPSNDSWHLVATGTNGTRLG